MLKRVGKTPPTRTHMCNVSIDFTEMGFAELHPVLKSILITQKGYWFYKLSALHTLSVLLFSTQGDNAKQLTLKKYSIVRSETGMEPSKTHKSRGQPQFKFGCQPKVSV